jgi:hypothetical protein
MPFATPSRPAPGSLPVFLTFDVGPDDAVLGHAHESAPAWTRTAAGLADAAALLDALAAHAGAPVAATWFVRADRHLAIDGGDALAAHAAFGDFLRVRRDRGDTIGWMPQVYSARGGPPDRADLDATCARLRDAGWDARAVRMGGLFHDDATMAALDRLGVEVDCSALPGRRKDDGGWRLDWTPTPDRAYHPSRGDYRVPGAPALDLVELPLSMVAIAAPYDTAPLPRYFNPAMHPALLAPVLAELAARTDYVQCVLHPDELRPPGPAGGHPLIAHSPDACLETLCRLVDAVRAGGREPRFLPVARAHLPAAETAP